MKKCFLMVLAGSLLLVSSFAFALETNNITAEAEYSYLKSDMDSLGAISVNVDSFLSAGLVGRIDDVKVQSGLIRLGYKVKDAITPYIVLGESQLKYNEALRGFINLPWGSAADDLLTTPFKGSGFTYGFGAKGVLAEYNGAKLGYDFSRTAFKADDNANTSLLGYPVPTSTEVKYYKWTVGLNLSKEFDLMEETIGIIKSITPIVGYKYSNVSIDIQKTYGNDDLSVNTQQNAKGSLHSVIAGADVNINDNVSVGVIGSFIDETGIIAKVAYRF